MRWIALSLLCSSAPALFGQQGKEDVLLQAMREEIARSRPLRIVNLDAPYYIEYAAEDATIFTVSATFGGIVSVRSTQMRIPRIDVRVGDYRFDNTNYLFSDFFQGPRFDAAHMPVDDELLPLRTHLWLSTDRAYKGAIEAIARKRSAMKNLAAQEEPLNDFSHAEPVRLILDVKKTPVDEALWTARVRSLSDILNRYPKVIGSTVDFEFTQTASYMVNSEGTEIRTPDHLAYLRIRAIGQAADGMPVRDSIQFNGRTPMELPPEAEMRRAVEEIGSNIEAQVAAPVGDTYGGPVLFEPLAAAQLFAQVLGQNLAPVRRPVNEPGRNFPIPASEFEGREGSRVLPEWMDVVDDPTQAEWHGRSLFGSYLVDMEGVRPVPLNLIEKGVLKNFLLTRQPVRGHEGSNGRARLPGSFGAARATFGNLFVRASETSSGDELKKRLLSMISQRGKPYGMLIRKLDFPSSTSIEELRKVIGGSNSHGRPLSPPLLAYRVYPDGREELVRGVRFRNVSARSLRDIIAASDHTAVFDYLENGAPMALVGAASYVANSTVVAPGVLFEDLEIERVEADWPRPPLVPPPTIVAAR